MTAPVPDWVEQARRFVVGSGLADALASFGASPGPGAASRTDPSGPAPGPATGGGDPGAGGHPGPGGEAGPDDVPDPGGDLSGAGHPAECRWCPVCVGIATVRGRRPDIVEALADVLTTAATLLRAHAAAGGEGPDGPSAPPDDPGASPDGSGAPPGDPGAATGGPDDGLRSDRPARATPPPATPVVGGPHPAPSSVPVQRIDVA
jgi:hypothetical protein